MLVQKLFVYYCLFWRAFSFLVRTRSPSIKRQKLVPLLDIFLSVLWWIPSGSVGTNLTSARARVTVHFNLTP